jgi:hypothetical protein
LLEVTRYEAPLFQFTRSPVTSSILVAVPSSATYSRKVSNYVSPWKWEVKFHTLVKW